MACFQKAGESEHVIPVSFMQDHFQYCLEVLEIKNVRDKAMAACPSGMQARITGRFLAREGVGRTKVLKDRTLAWQEKEI
jgi:rhodanese-related sulfurtransferase